MGMVDMVDIKWYAYAKARRAEMQTFKE